MTDVEVIIAYLPIQSRIIRSDRCARVVTMIVADTLS